jgi:hypothetical protein
MHTGWTTACMVMGAVAILVALEVASAVVLRLVTLACLHI